MIVFIFAAISFTYSVTVQCEFESYDYAIEVNQYTSVATLLFDGNITHMIAVTGNHLSEKTNADVTAFWIESNHGEYDRIPRGLNQFFPNLLVFVWQFGNLTTLEADDLEPFPVLREIWLPNNKLFALDGDLFKHTPQLGFIYFDYNRITHVGFGLLDGLNSLIYAYFQGNPCINAFADDSEQIPELKLKLQNQCQPLETTTAPTTTLSFSTTLVPTTEISTASELTTPISTSTLATTSEIISTTTVESSTTINTSTSSEASTTTGTSTESGLGSIECYGFIKKLIYFHLIHVFYVYFT